jgi:hypothetical protein
MFFGKKLKWVKMLFNCSLKTKCLIQSGLQTRLSIGKYLLWQRRRINCNDLIKMFMWMVAWTNHDEYICWGWHKPLFGKDVRLRITFNIMSKFGRQHRPFRGCFIGNRSFLQRYFCTIYICFPLLQKTSPNVINNHILITCVWASSIFLWKK